jgi:hypothetical protein
MAKNDFVQNLDNDGLVTLYADISYELQKRLDSDYIVGTNLWSIFYDNHVTKKAILNKYDRDKK